jgi:L-iditol 2-dehydrogenase
VGPGGLSRRPATGATAALLVGHRSSSVDIVTVSRPGGRVMLFAQTAAAESFRLNGASMCVGERTVFGSYSASVDLQEESAGIVWRQDFPVEALISHRLPLKDIERGIDLARQPGNGSLKLIMHPQR